MDLGTFIIQLIAAGLTVGVFILVFYLFHRIAAARQKRSKTIFVCPKCLNTNYTYLKHLPSDTPFIGSLRSTNYFKCNSCGFEGVFPLVNIDEIPQMRKEMSKKLVSNKQSVSKKKLSSQKKTTSKTSTKKKLSERSSKNVSKN